MLAWSFASTPTQPSIKIAFSKQEAIYFAVEVAPDMLP
jgi:hypothetical protein